jgi:hypothetical protein
MAQAIATSAICRAKARKSPEGQHQSVLGAQLPTLEKMLWGGTVVLLVDHAIHGELFSFSLRELLTVGVPMSVIMTAIWACWALYKSRKKTALEVQ